MNTNMILNYASYSKNIIELLCNTPVIFNKPLNNPTLYFREHEKEFIEMVNSRSFTTNNYNGVFKYFHDEYIRSVEGDVSNNPPKLIMIDNETDEEFYGHMRDIIVDNVSSSLWLHDKQVFEFSDELVYSLLGNKEDLDLAEIKDFYFGWMNYLPYKAFCIDISENKIKIFKKSKAKGIVCYPYKLNNIWHMVYAIMDEEGRQIGFSDILADIGNTVGEFELFDLYYATDTSRKEGYALPDTTVCGILLCMMYLSSKKPDAAKSETTKKIYRGPTEFVKNKPREICQWNIGFRYAESIKTIHNHINECTRTNSSHTKRPHVRRAHWHHYWMGSGSNKHLELLWINQCGVNIKTEFESELPFVSRVESVQPKI